MAASHGKRLTSPRSSAAHSELKRVLYGRRKGRKLKGGRKAAYETLLPALAIPAGDAPLDPRALFARPVADVWVEIGFGSGEHLAAQAAAHPDIGFLGAEPFENGIAALLTLVGAGSLANIRIWQDDVRLLLARLPDASIGRLFVLFPDPWPKARHHKRRIIGPTTIPEFARVMKDGAELRFASDAADYVNWARGHMAEPPGFVLASDRRGADWPETRYEAKARAAGRACSYLAWRKKPCG